VRSSLLAAALALAAFLAFVLRSDPGRADERSRGSPYAALDDSESSYRLRLVELVLDTGRAPPRDDFLDPRGPSAVPWPPLVHSAIAFAAARVLPRDPQRAELGGFDESDLERFTRWIGPVLGALTALVAALAASILAGPRLRAGAAVAAALTYAVLPLALAREVAGSLHAHPWVALLGFAQLAAFGLALQPRERVDATVGALVCGLFGGLGLVSGQESWPTTAAVLGVLVVLALRAGKGASREPWRAVMLTFAAALTVVTLADSDATLRLWLPDFSQGAQGLLASSPATFLLVLVPLALACAATIFDRVDPLRAALLGLSFVAFTCAVFDRRFFAPLSIATVATVSSAATGTWLRSRIERVRAGGAALSLTLAAALVVWIAGGRDDGRELRDAAREALRWMREPEHTPSPGSYHPQAAPSWRVAAVPELAGSLAFHARRPARCASFDGWSTASVPEVQRIFAGDDLHELAVALAHLDSPYLVVTPRMLRDPRYAEAARRLGSVLARLALPESREPGARAGELELVFASSVEDGTGERAGPALSIWRRSGPDGRASAAPVLGSDK
jgi:hypothetical protein